ncbi:MAG: putative HTH-type transcriptional regulator YusO [Candidatus Dichloromethanomonas elyunquensis]|nr:MAG: putative HTH-type transcriptional regulator YusO [Candidatus Dichloromethanomonas elyunquensis]
MRNTEKQALLILLKEIKSLIDKCLKSKLDFGDYTVPQTMVIYHLASNGRMKISKLSEKIGLTNSTVSGIVDRLENQGAVIRERSAEDRRVVYVELTPEHQNKHKEIHAALDQYLEDMLSDIPQEQMASIIKSLHILRDTFLRNLKKPASKQ